MNTVITLAQLADVLGIAEPDSVPKIAWFERADHGRLHALDWGGSGPNVLLLHGGALSAHTWTLCCLLLRQSYHCVAIDLRGHGDSDWAGDYSIPAHVSDVHQVLTQLNWRSAHLVGMSLGGVIAAHAALTESETAIASLTLVDVAPGVSFGDTQRLREFMTSPVVHEGAEALKNAARGLGAAQSDEELLYRYNSLICRDTAGIWQWKHDRRKPFNYQDVLDHLSILEAVAHKMHCPCLVARGGRSRILSEEAANQFARACPQGQFCTVPQAGHSVQEDNPQQLVAALKMFWESVTEADKARTSADNA